MTTVTDIITIQDQQHAWVLHHEEHGLCHHRRSSEGFTQVEFIIMMPFSAPQSSSWSPLQLSLKIPWLEEWKLCWGQIYLQRIYHQCHRTHFFILFRFGSPVIEDWIHICSSVNAVSGHHHRCHRPHNRHQCHHPRPSYAQSGQWTPSDCCERGCSFRRGERVLERLWRHNAPVSRQLNQILW